MFSILVVASLGGGALALASAPSGTLLARSSDLELRSLGSGPARALVVRGGGGALNEVVIRRTDAAIDQARLVATGVDALIFASWRESGYADGDYLSLSRDGGRSWSEARPQSHRLELLNGGFRPAAGQRGVVPGNLAARPGARLGILQLATPSLAALRAALIAEGVEILGYLPENAHLVRMSPAVEARVRVLPFVRWVGPYHPIYRIEPELLDRLGNPDPRAGRSRYVLMTPAAGRLDKQRLGAAIEALGGTILAMTDSGRILEAELDEAQAAELTHSDDLLWLERWSAPEPDMDIVRSVSGANYVEGVGNFTGQGVSGEVLDGGCELVHQDFAGIQAHGTIASNGCHGTSTYGIVFGNGSGDGRARGLLPDGNGWAADYSQLSDRDQHTLELTQPPIEALFQSNSWGSSRTLHYGALSNQMDDIAWKYDFQIFQSQSNSGDQYSRPQAWAKNVISIGAVFHRDSSDLADDCFCNGASIGPAEDGRLKPDLAYWYDSIYTTTSSACGGSYDAGFGGTSAATPIVAGIGGLVYQMWAANVLGNNPQGSTVFEKRPHPSTMKALLIATADSYPFSGQGVDMARVRQGWGLPSARNVLNRAARIKVVDEQVALQELSAASYLATVPAGEPDLRISMVYTDLPAAPSAAIHRVNDLTLRVTAPDGTLYWGNNALSDGPWSLPGGAADRLNNVENVFIQNPLAGDWRIEIFADEVNQDQHTETPEADQDFGLVVVGSSGLTECAASVAVPTGLVAAASAANTVRLTWNGSAAGYEIWRGLGGCAAPRVLVASTAARSYDDAGVAGGVRYGYVVRALSGCPSPPSTCVEVTPTGSCNLAPVFAGLESAGAVAGPTCGLRLGWAAAVSAGCTGPVVYNIYRSNTPSFTPDAATRIASCVSGTSHVDTRPLQPTQEYSYIVRAEDIGARGSGPCGGVEEGNLRRRSLTPLTILRSDFENGSDGWTLTPHNDGVTGEFIAGDPEGTMSGSDAAQPEDDHTAAGTQCLFTGRNPNRALSQADVDFGEVEAISPIFDPTPFGNASLSLWRWYFNRDRDADATDFFLIEASNDGGSNWVQLERLGDQVSANAWTRVSFNLASTLALTNQMRIRIVASEAGSMSNVVEVAIDDVEISTTSSCVPAVAAPGVITGRPGPLLAARQGNMVRMQWANDCGSATAYGLYRGDLASVPSSLAAVPGMCDLAAPSVDFPLVAGNHFYLVAPNDGAVEGSLGLVDLALRRPQPATYCYPRSGNIDSCAP